MWYPLISLLIAMLFTGFVAANPPRAKNKYDDSFDLYFPLVSLGVALACIWPIALPIFIAAKVGKRFRRKDAA